jgi:lysophospholipase L1-like esterase
MTRPIARKEFRMKRSLFACLLITLIAPLASAEPAGLRDGDRVAIVGDSITEQKLYSVFIEDYLLMCRPKQHLQTMQFGWGGETSWGFFARMSDDLQPYKPTVATTCYGMNDGGYGPLKDENRQRYADSMNKIVAAMKEAGVRFIVVGSPGAVDTTSFKVLGTKPEVYNKTLAELSDVARDVAEKQGVAFADVHGVMMDVMTRAKEKFGSDYFVAGKDGVHPGANGHLVMAYAFLKALRLRRQHRGDHGRPQERPGDGQRGSQGRFRQQRRGRAGEQQVSVLPHVRRAGADRLALSVQPGPQPADAQGDRRGKREAEGDVGRRVEDLCREGPGGGHQPRGGVRQESVRAAIQESRGGHPRSTGV